MTATQQTRPARPEDWDEILPLLEGMEGVDIRSDATARQRFEHIVQSPDHYLPVAVDGEHLVGYGWVQDYGPHLRTGARTARLHDLFVVPERRRRGIGLALFLAVKTWAERRGVRYLEWQASRAAIPFYERLGYTGDPCPQPDYPFFEIECPVDSRAPGVQERR
jgi:GNAT superfamily N-acetyltransferase